MDQGWSAESSIPFNASKRSISIHEEDSDHDSKRICSAFLTQPSASQNVATSSHTFPTGSAQDDDLRYESVNAIQQSDHDLFPLVHLSSQDNNTTTAKSCWTSPSGIASVEAEPSILGPRGEIDDKKRTNIITADPTDPEALAELDRGQCNSATTLNATGPIIGCNGTPSTSRFGTSPSSGYIEKGSTSVQYSVCFGVVMISATSSFNSSQGGKTTPVTIRKCGDILKLKTLDSNKYAGMISSPVLGKLLDEFNVRFSATLELQLSSAKDSRGKIAELDRPQPRTVRIVMYGLKCDRFFVGNILSEADLFLQQPSATECERGIEYCNPHYLLRPGSQMPRLDALSISSDTQSTGTSEVLDEVNKHRFMQIFDTAHDTKICSRIEPSGRLASALKDHQITALVMMIEKECGIIDKPVFPAIWELKRDSEKSKKYRHKVTGLSENFPIPVHGGILADDMGLGKTLSLLALICSSLDMLKNENENLPSHGAVSKATLVVAPKSTIPGWQQQIAKHIKSGHLRVAIYHGSARQRVATNFGCNDIVLTTYETLRSDWIASGPIYSENWYRLVLDEAHHIRNRSSQTFKAACAVLCQYRWCLTGTPIHNSLDDYGALLSFIGVSPFTEKSQFDYWITSPIKNGGAESFKRLQTLVKATCLRRTKRTVGLSLALPQRVEEIEYIDLHPADRRLYDFFKTKTAKIAAGIASHNEGTAGLDQTKERNILVLINFLRVICNHGTQLLPESAIQAWKAQDSTLVDWQLMQTCRKRCDKCEADISEPEPLLNTFYTACQHSICEACALCITQNITVNEMRCPKCVIQLEHGIAPGIRSHALTVPPSAKIEALLRNLRSEQIQRDLSTPAKQVKSVIFSYWTKMLDLIQSAVVSRGFNCQRIDGGTSLEGRRSALSKFNEDPKYTVMLASIGSAGEGVDLTAANHVHLIEPHWNPMAEAQAVDRVHRIGQNRDVVVRRYIVSDSIETYIQWIQKHKMNLISRSMDSSDISQSELDNERWESLRLHLDHSAN